MSENFEDTKKTLEDFNIVKDEVAKLCLNPSRREFYDTDIEPLLKMLLELSYGSSNLSNVAKNLSSINYSKTSKIEDSLDLIYDINKSIEKVFNQLQCEIKDFLKIPSSDICCKKGIEEE
ncbi:hypothetical protein [Clostridium grantii]|uniref:Uncharacterized protein n=1 Tax=Clostridium grantii DSM 8605 TaxID=1121316 RepID=A0A1M5SL57_9CLOT|nr:hypothetical protein [Clostridium grantii]SHH39150.1 hypothetical protein SAMN02745207_00993 [Clostridium grantii DSM 8605]